MPSHKKHKINWDRYYGGKHYKPIGKHWFDSPAYRATSCTARCLLHEIMMRETNNNGRIVFSNAQAQKALNVSGNTAKNAFLELIKSGFVEAMTGENWRKGIAREWRLTMWMCDGRDATNEWRIHDHENQKTPSKNEDTTSKFDGASATASTTEPLYEDKKTKKPI